MVTGNWHLPNCLFFLQVSVFIFARIVAVGTNVGIQPNSADPLQSYGCQCWALLHLLLYTVKWQLTLCFKSLKPIQNGLCMLMYLSIHLHGLHLDARYGQTTSVNTVTQWRADWSSASVVNHTIVTDLTIRQPDFDLPRRTWSPMNHFRSGQGPCHVNLQHMPINIIWRWTESTPQSIYVAVIWLEFTMTATLAT